MTKVLKTRTLFSASDIQKRIETLGEEISRDHQGQTLIIIGVLKGSFIFVADLIRQIDLPMNVEFIGVSSYQGMNSTGQVRITYDLGRDISNQHVILVEDIIDTGLTIDYLLNLLSMRKPKSLKICTLLSKPESHSMQHKIDYVGFEISREFVVGYGLDFNGQYRNLSSIEQVLSE